MYMNIPELVSIGTDSLLSVLNILLPTRIFINRLRSIQWRPLWLFLEQPHSFDILYARQTLSQSSVLEQGMGAPTFCSSVVNR